jgi:hypothetical protein
MMPQQQTMKHLLLPTMQTAHVISATRGCCCCNHKFTSEYQEAQDDKPRIHYAVITFKHMDIFSSSLQLFTYISAQIGTAFSGSDNLSSIWREKSAYYQSSQNLKIIEPSSSVEAEMLAPSQGHRTQ